LVPEGQATAQSWAALHEVPQYLLFRFLFAGAEDCCFLKLGLVVVVVTGALEGAVDGLMVGLKEGAVDGLVVGLADGLVNTLFAVTGASKAISS
jgi:hypothetical protein